MRRLLWLFPVSTLALGACTVGPDWKAPSPFAPSTWFAARPKPTPAPPPPSEPVAAPIDAAWWNRLNDPGLTALEARVAAANFNVRVAVVRLLENRAQRGITAADQFPSLNGNGSYTRERISQKGVVGLFGGGASSGGQRQSFGSLGGSANGLGGRQGGFPGGGLNLQPFNLWQYGFDASWELDLWGRVRREVESADATVAAGADAARGALISVQAELARDYIQLRGIQAQLDITRRNATTARESLDLTQARFRAGLTTDLDVANAAAQLATTESQIPGLEQQQDEQINAISFLLGLAPQSLRAELVTPKAIPPVPPTVPVGLPAELARRRPDIREAEARLHAATADIGVAVADFYPRITLDGSLGIQATKFKDLGNWGSRQYGLGPTISVPIFQGGRLRATLQLRKVEQQEAALSYQQTVLQAWHDVDNALTAYTQEQRRRDALARAVTENRRALELSRQRYRQGVSDFLNVLDAERALLSAELQLAQSTTSVSGNFVQLYKALGGGWEAEMPEPSREGPRRT